MMKKLTALCLALLLCGVSAVSAQETTVREDVNEAWKQVQTDTAQLWTDVSSALQEAGQTIGGSLQEAGQAIGSSLQEASTNLFAGTWSFTNGKCKTTIACTADGKMTLVAEDKASTTTWKGTYEVKLGKVLFHVEECESGVFIFKKNRAMSETWILSYVPYGFRNMRFSSDDLPDDGNGYDFSNPTIFLAEEK